jgi:hypothetical protein
MYLSVGKWLIQKANIKLGVEGGMVTGYPIGDVVPAAVSVVEVAKRVRLTYLPKVKWTGAHVIGVQWKIDLD